MVLLTPRPEISQQRGFVHAGTVSAIADTAAGYAALSMMPADRAVLTTEFKIDLVATAVGQRIVAEGRVVKSGRTLTLAQRFSPRAAANGGSLLSWRQPSWLLRGETRTVLARSVARDGAGNLLA